MRALKRPVEKEHPPNALSRSNVCRRRGRIFWPLTQQRLHRRLFMLVALCLTLLVIFGSMEDFFLGQIPAVYAATASQQLIHRGH